MTQPYHSMQNEIILSAVMGFLFLVFLGWCMCRTSQSGNDVEWYNDEPHTRKSGFNRFPGTVEHYEPPRIAVAPDQNGIGNVGEVVRRAMGIINQGVAKNLRPVR